MSEVSSHAHPSFRGKRLFLAIELPDYVRQRLSELREEPLKGFHWVPEERFHLTLKFIGDFPGQYQPRVEAALDPIEVHSFLLPIESLGSFPPKGSPHAVWAGVANGHPRLFQLQKRIEDALFNIGIEPERRLYQPHITVARVNHAAPETVRQYLKRHKEFATAPFKVEAFHLFRSEQTNGQRSYTCERTWPLLD
ncbi:MAG: RNA 2',3'-cyclic phosphodiesterase [Verrucomicrobia bacterium]|jgi:2'-5' RNA ligase|nr:RNA 2',3'-cyclic phosphodiesterase [Verrucomicrobiota bacterium]